MNIIDLEREEFLRIPGLGPEETDALVKMIEELTIVEEPAELSSQAPADATPVASGGGPFIADAETETAEAEAVESGLAGLVETEDETAAERAREPATAVADADEQPEEIGDGESTADLAAEAGDEVTAEGEREDQ